MATRSEQFRYWQERSGTKKEKRPARPRRDLAVDTSLPGISATHRKAGGASTARRNFSLRAGRNAPWALEDSASGSPSRKSTRKSANALKPSHPLRVAKRGERIRGRRR